MSMSRGSTPTKTRPGDVVEVFGHRVGDAARSGEILEVLGPEGHPHYRVRWEDGRISLLYPGADVLVKHQQPSRRAVTAD